MGDIIEEQYLRLMNFVEVQRLFRIPSKCKAIQQELQSIAFEQWLLSTQSEEQPWADQCLQGKIQFLQVTTSILYHCSIESSQWLSSKAEQEQKVEKSDL